MQNVCFCSHSAGISTIPGPSPPLLFVFVGEPDSCGNKGRLLWWRCGSDCSPETAGRGRDRDRAGQTVTVCSSSSWRWRTLRL